MLSDRLSMSSPWHPWAHTCCTFVIVDLINNVQYCLHKYDIFACTQTPTWNQTDQLWCMAQLYTNELHVWNYQWLFADSLFLHQLCLHFKWSLALHNYTNSFTIAQHAVFQSFWFCILRNHFIDSFINACRCAAFDWWCHMVLCPPLGVCPSADIVTSTTNSFIPMPYWCVYIITLGS